MSEHQSSDDDSTTTVVIEENQTKRKHQPRYNVVLIDDNDHTYDYVIRMLGRVFGYGEDKAYTMACEVDVSGRVILLTTTLEHAELKQQQIHAFGPDPHVPTCKGSMTSVLEPVPEG